MQNAAEKLEFSKIKEAVSSYSKTEIGKREILSLNDFLPYEDLKKEKNLMKEMSYAHERFSFLPLSSSKDLSSLISFASKGGALKEEELSDISSELATIKEIDDYFSQFEDDNPLKSLALDHEDVGFIKEKIDKAIAPDLSIFDDATLELKNIRNAIKRLNREIAKKVQSLVSEHSDYLTSSSLTIRDGHYVLPVSTSYKNKVKGLILDISHSGGTTFIEPEGLIMLNNKMKELENDEKQEIHKILSSLSLEVGRKAKEIKKINETIARLDFIEAKVRYMYEINGSIAILEKEPKIILKEARHPLIDKNKVVPNDFTINNDTPIYVISGPNAGGKTIALKTVGLLLFMNECGLPIPAKEGSILGYFNHIYVDIGDSQSISDSLSTFSGHMKNLSELLNVVSSSDLVLLDEVGTGTSPKEGESLAYAILMELKKKKAFALVSSHFEGLKAAAMEEEGIKNASMRFSEETLSPTYKLIEGIPGDSYGLIVAKRFGMKKEILDLANEKLNENSSISINDALRKLNEASSSLEKEKEALSKKEKEIERKEKEIRENEERIEKRLRFLNEEIKREKEKELKEFKEKADKILGSLNTNSIRKGDITKAKTKLDELKDKEEEALFNEELNIGDYVSLPSLSLSGRIVSINGSNVTFVSKEGMSFSSKKERLTKIMEPKEKRESITGIKVDETGLGASLPLELNLIGMRAEPALSSLDAYLDKCRIKKYKRVRIIHGFGSGILRKVVREYLDKHKEFVDHYEMADGNEGAGGATIVYLK